MILDLDYRTWEIPNTDGATLDIRPLEIGPYQKIISMLASNTAEKDGDAAQIGMRNMSKPELMKLSLEIIPLHCQNLKGLKVKQAGAIRDLTIDELTKQGACAVICFQILTQLFAISALSKEESEAVKKQEASLS